MCMCACVRKCVHVCLCVHGIRATTITLSSNRISINYCNESTKYHNYRIQLPLLCSKLLAEH